MDTNVHRILSSQKVEATQISTDEWIYQMWLIHTIEYYLAIKRNVLILATPWMNHGNILSERSYSEKVTYSIIPLI